eukprot:g1753.t1
MDGNDEAPPLAPSVAAFFAAQKKATERQDEGRREEDHVLRTNYEFFSDFVDKPVPMASENLAGLSNVPDVEAEVLSDTFASVFGDIVFC